MKKKKEEKKKDAVLLFFLERRGRQCWNGQNATGVRMLMLNGAKK